MLAVSRWTALPLITPPPATIGDTGARGAIRVLMAVRPRTLPAHPRPHHLKLVVPLPLARLSAGALLQGGWPAAGPCSRARGVTPNRCRLPPTSWCAQGADAR